jgi:hypothetical protein
MKVCELSDESSDVVQCNAKLHDAMRCRRCRMEAWKDVRQDRKDVGRDRSTEET